MNRNIATSEEKASANGMASQKGRVLKRSDGRNRHCCSIAGMAEIGMDFRHDEFFPRCELSTIV
jgi:hypothetical protein